MSDRNDLQGYLDGLAAGELRFQRCAKCRHAQWPPRPVCTSCRSADPTWERFPDTALVYTWTVVNRSRLPGFADLTPYIVAVLEIPEMFLRIVGRIDATPDRVDFGARCRWRITEGTAGQPVPLWAVAEESA